MCVCKHFFKKLDMNILIDCIYITVYFKLSLYIKSLYIAILFCLQYKFDNFD